MIEEQLSREYAVPVIYVPRWRVFAYRAAGWTVSGALAEEFVEMTWPYAEEPVFLPARLDLDRLNAMQHVSCDAECNFFESRLVRRFK